MIELNEPQVWTLIGVFAAALFGMFTLMSGMFVRMMTAGFDGLRNEMTAEFASVRKEMAVEFASVRSEMAGEFASVRSELHRVEGVLSTKVDHLDRDVSAMAKRVFPDPPAA